MRMSVKAGRKNLKYAATLALATAIMFVTTGCASFENEVAKRGSLIGSTKGDYIIINTSGDLILDIYKLRDAYVSSEASSDGWNFIDQKGNPIMLGGDVKMIRVKDRNTWDAYEEYHYDLEFVEQLRKNSQE